MSPPRRGQAHAAEAEDISLQTLNLTLMGVNPGPSYAATPSGMQATEGAEPETALPPSRSFSPRAPAAKPDLCLKVAALA